MSDFDWLTFLRDWSGELLAASEIAGKLPADVKNSGWLGFAGASEEEIAAAETRLGKKLPPSYRSFLKVTNGWRTTGFFIDRLWGTDKIDWFRVRHAEWIADWNLGASQYPPRTPEEALRDLDSDGHYLPSAVEISDVGDSAIYLLNPEIVAADGEWQAWFFSNWNPGAVRHRSFQEMMVAERKNFLYVRDHRR
jgi:SMI1 / KNR4 family (SUKH-1)